MAEDSTMAAISARIVAVEPRLGSTRLVAVDGPAGAGKSTFAARLAKVCGGQIVPTDDFAAGNNKLPLWSRLERQVLEPIAAGLPGRYRRFDWYENALAEWHDVATGGVLILDGVSSSRAVVRDRLSLAIWVDAPRPARLTRGLARDGAHTLALWEEWMALEDTHFAADHTREHADLIVSGA